MRRGTRYLINCQTCGKTFEAMTPLQSEPLGHRQIDCNACFWKRTERPSHWPKARYGRH